MKPTDTTIKIMKYKNLWILTTHRKTKIKTKNDTWIFILTDQKKEQIRQRLKWQVTNLQWNRNYGREINFREQKQNEEVFRITSNSFSNEMWEK